MLTERIKATLQLLDARIAGAQRPVVWASGGKDSTVLLHLCQLWRNWLTVVHACKDGDDGWPDITTVLHHNCAAWSYPHVRNVRPWLAFPDYVEQFGWPVEVVPTTLEGATAMAPSPYRTESLKVASWLHCTYVRTIFPLIEDAMTTRADLILTGSRLSDAPANAAFAQDVPMPEAPGWARCNPLADWTTDEIWAYVDMHQLTLPAYYAWKRDATFEAVDCLSCTWQPEHWPILKEHYPEEYAKRWPAAQDVYRLLHRESQTYQDRLTLLPLAKD